MAEYTIDELARAADTTVRSVRVYHERGLLPSPDVRGRIGYYGANHLERLQTISRLLSRGMKLNGIRELLEAWDRGDGLADVLGVADAPPTADAPDQLEHHAPELPGYLQDALASSDDPLDAYRLNNPRCWDLASRLVDAGLPVAVTFELVERLRTDAERLADDHATELFYHLAGHTYEQSERTSRDRAKLETDLAITRLIVTRALDELVGQAFERRAELPAPPANHRASQ
ncbi:MerR family transcriptional regulator [Nocardia sp. alder85J]|uniref:MerR family transcriptional regulator n=1 Tax=Nocardia sp. alder85J TaxID=2862949 RepID=UPI001CD7C99A|nr:MerR family transcriptional regulator [Nocardia sp. alder85J]MCX4092160.1 MerR family transcriptional regulator [Nocardia sp. alder85J]